MAGGGCRIIRTMGRWLVAGLLVCGLAVPVFAAHGGGGGGGGESAEENLPFRKPVEKKKEYGCYMYFVQRAENDFICRIILEGHSKLGSGGGLSEEEAERLRDRLFRSRVGIPYAKLLPRAGASQIPNWCDLKHRMERVDAILAIEREKEERKKKKE